jgi:undecaprenyl-diphosphatase
LIIGDEPVAWVQLAFGAFVSCVVAYLSIEFFMRFVSRIGLAPFAIYRILLAATIFYVLT